VLALVGIGFVVATFVFLLPTIANYGDVWDVVTELSWQWLLALVAVTAINILTFAPPWQVALPGLRFVQALELTQASTAAALVLPGGPATGMAISFGMLRSWRFRIQDITRAVTLVGIWNQFLTLAYPVLAMFLLTATGAETALLATAAFVGTAVLGVAIAALVTMLVSNRLAFDIGELVAALASRVRGWVRRPPVGWGGPSFERFRNDAGALLRRRWHVLTAASLAGSLSVFVVLLVSLRALGVTAEQVSAVEAFAAWALVRVIAMIPITPGGVGIVELGLTSALVGFGGGNANVVAAVLVYRFLTVVPTLTLGLIAGATWRRHRPPVAVETPTPPVPLPPA
jgi:uncharacterized membrane protein YbhN (UPF0104 family)